jgi:hypothetical protein
MKTLGSAARYTIHVCREGCCLHAVQLCGFCGDCSEGAKDRGVLAATQARAPCFGPVSAVTAHTTCSSHQFVITPFIMRCCSDLSPQQRLLEFW